MRKTNSKFYNSKSWKICRASYIKKVDGLCEMCGKPGYIVHHKIELNNNNVSDINISLNHDNLQYLCIECHNKVTWNDRQSTASGVMFDEYGNVVIAPM